ncbi:hypothetical protein JKF63_07601 [Porcisia hertigi]|uniref:Uncharacterized protein n=1 Tax=Porcisia hertigi TaxID=2761500 RepID=A0A836LMB5_9TRYP|nr:hypothetical protein JKF63_07601 [Porcisia hertigi]
MHTLFTKGTRPAALELKWVASVDTPLTCNCLLAAPLSPCSAPGSLSPQNSVTPEGSAVRDSELCFFAASYELTSSSGLAAVPNVSEVRDVVESGDPRHVGDCALYQCLAAGEKVVAGGTLVEVQRCTSALPGVFDLVSVPLGFFGIEAPVSSADAPPCVMMACTDGSVRVLDPFKLSPLMDPLHGLHPEMLTSCTPLHCPTPHLLCSAHTGAVFLYSLAERVVTQELEGHEYDAWCTAMLPTGGWCSDAPLASREKSRHGAGDDANSEAEAGLMLTSDRRTSVLLASGGDDGYCKLYDMRTNTSRAVSRTRFDAGVVSITSVLNTLDGLATAHTTPYLLVGSYDESISLMDVRAMRRPVAQRGRLGGGVWRTSRCLLPLWDSGVPAPDTVRAVAGGDEGDVNLSLLLASAKAHCPRSELKRPRATQMIANGWVNTANVLVLPLMQGGAALLPYDVQASAEEVFGNGSVPLTYFYAEGAEGNSEAMPSATAFPKLTDNTLVYDAAVLRPLDWTDSSGASTAEDKSAAVLATVSFYEKRIDVWTVTVGPPRVGSHASNPRESQEGGTTSSARLC